jgi:conjugative transfer signal peptidase TraF
VAWFPRFLHIIGPIALAPIIGGALAVAVGVRVVWTDSLPRGLYWVHRGDVHRGVIVSACLPPEIARVGLRHGYIPDGRCPGGAGGVAKIVAAVGGDTVHVDGDGVSVNGRLWPWSAATQADWSGPPALKRLRFYRIPPGMVVLMGLNAKSWDSRYFGPISQSLISGIATPLLIEGGAASQILHTMSLQLTSNYRKRTA